MDNEISVFRSIELIESRISEKLTVENIANGAHFSKYHYSRLFREIIGDSVMEYVTKRKLTLAGKALLESSASIIDIATEYGYDSREGFTRSFKMYMGVSPTDYRKYGLTAISQKIVKERRTMVYSKTTDEIIRELNDFIANAKVTAQAARKCEVEVMTQFWNLIADKTDDFANKTHAVLGNITVIAEHPDGITNRFAIIKIIEDIAFHSNLLAFNVGLMVSRGQPEHIKAQWPLYERYLELARTATLKAERITGFFNELSALIFEDMRKTSADKINSVITKGKAAIDGITGYENIKAELSNVVAYLSVPVDEIPVSLLEETFFKVLILSFAADMDVCRNPKDKVMFEGLATFKESLSEAIEFFQTLVKPENNPISERNIHKHFQDIAYQGNIMLFYTRDEIEKLGLGNLLSDEQRVTLDEICGKINNFIYLAHNATDETAFKPIADKLYSIHSDMTSQADHLKEKGSAVRFLADEFKGLADYMMKRIG